MASVAHKPGPSSSGNDSPNSSSPREHIPPPAPRKKESGKRRRNPLSCAECRRLKLRCDRVFPCESCRKRGCAAICPEGALRTKGTRFVLANTEELHAKIVDMSERIRQLEDALAAAHPSESHPLLSEDLLLVKVPIEFKNENTEQKSLSKPSPSEENGQDPNSLPAVMTAFGTLKIGNDGYTRFFGQTARSEHFLQDDKDPVEISPSRNKYSLPPEILQICHSFPFGGASEDKQLIHRILTYLPPLDDAWALVENYYSHGIVMYEPCRRTYFTEHVWKHVCEYLPEPGKLSKHRLALVFAILALGAFFDLSREPYSSSAEQFHLLSRACLGLTPLLAEPSIYAIQTLHLLALYSVLSNNPAGGPVAWVLQGLNVKLAEALGLHRDLEYWGADDQEKSQVEVRRLVFWEMIAFEGWLCLGLGRPATLHFSHIDCKLPADTQRAMAVPDNSLHVWRTWKHPYSSYVNRVLQKALDAKTPPYSEIMELDRNIHRYTMPPDVEALAKGLPVSPPSPEETPWLTLQRSLILQARYTALLLLHRGFFAQALSERNDPMQSKYAPSVLATYRSACFVIMSLYHSYEKHPALTCRYGLYWSNSFSASLALCMLVTRATASSYAPLALGHLDLVYDLFSKAASDCYPARKALPMATKLHEKAHAAFAPYGDGQHPTSVASRRPLDLDDDDDDDELSVLGGKTNVLSDNPLTGLQTPRPQSTYPESPGMPLQMPPTNHLDSVHPSLVQYVAETPWMSDLRGTEHMNHSHIPLSTPLTSRHPLPPSLNTAIPPLNHSSYPPQQHQLYAENVALPPVQNYRSYSTYTSGSNIHASPTVPDSEGFPPSPEYTYYDQSYPPEGRPHPSPPDVPPPQQENQYATWQSYVQQLYR